MADMWVDVDPIDWNDPQGSLERLSNDPDARWYLNRTLDGLVAALVAAGQSWKWQLRGPDGRWIRMFSWVRFLDSDTKKWKGGVVTKIDDDTGDVTVRHPDGKTTVFSKAEASKKLYARPKPKAKLNLPSVKKSKTVDGFTKIGGQGGSNPGALFQVDMPSFEKAPDLDRGETLHVLSALGKEKPWGFAINDENQSFGTPSDDMIIAVPRLDGTPGKYDILYASGGHWYRVPPHDEGHRLSDGSLSAEHRVDPINIYGPPGSDRRKALVALGEDGVIAVHRGDGVDADQIVGLTRDTGADAPVLGDQFYIKNAGKGDPVDRARNEALANMLYEMAGVPVPDVAIGDDGETVASKIVPNTTELSQHLNDDAVIKSARSNFLFDAWLANWDAVGLTYDNMKVDDEGNVFRIDAGGALLYRAQGSPKGDKFGIYVGELTSMRDPSMNGTAAKVYGGITDAELAEQAARLAAITPDDIRDMVDAHHMPPYLADILIARRKDIFDQLGMPQLADLPEDLPQPEPEVFNPVTKQMQPGKPPTAAVDNYVYTLGNMPTTILEGGPAANAIEDVVWQVYGEPHQVTDVQDTYSNGFTARMTNMVTGEDVGLISVSMDETPVYVDLPDGSNLDAYYPDDFAVQIVPDLQAKRDLALAEIGNDYADNPLGPYPDLGSKASAALWPEVDFKSKSDLESLFTAEKSTGGPFTPLYQSNAEWGGDGGAIYEVIDYQPTGGWVAVRGPDGNAQTMFLSDLEANNFMVPNDVMEAIFRAHINKRNAAWAQADKPDMPEPKVDEPDLPEAPEPEWIGQAVFDALAEKPPTPDAPPSMVYDDYIHPSLGASDEIIGTNVTPDMAPALMQQLQGKPVVVLSKNYLDGNTSSPNYDEGLFWIEEIKVGHNDSVWARVLNATGQARDIKLSGSYGYTKEVSIFPVDVPNAPLANAKLTMKKDGTITIGSTQIGTWEKGVWSGYFYTIDADYSITGKPVKIKTYKKGNIKNEAKQYLNLNGPAQTPQVKPKTAKHHDLESKIKGTAPATALNDGNPVTAGTHVISTVTGNTYIVQNDDMVDGLVQVKVPGKDGGVKFLPADTLNVFKPGEAATTKMITVNGQPAGVGALFKTKTHGPEGDAWIVDVTSDGKVLASIKGGGDLFLVDVNDIDTITDPWKATTYEPGGQANIVPPIPKTGPMPEPVKVGPAKYAAPGGKLIVQSQAKKDAHTAKGLDLTKDGFAPEVGMIVRRPDGNKYQIVELGNPLDDVQKQKVKLVPVDAPDETPKLFKIDTLYVDHQAILTDKGGADLTVISQFDGLAWTPPDGAKLFHQVKVEKKTLDGVTREMDVDYYYLISEGEVYVLHSGKNLTTGSSKKIQPSQIADNPESDYVGYIDSSAGGKVLTLQTVAPADSMYQHTVTGMAIHEPGTDGNKVIAEAKAAQAESAAEFAAPVFEGSTAKLTTSTLPHPKVKSSAPPVPEATITSAKGTHFDDSGIPGTQSISQAVAASKKAVDDKKGWNVRKAIADHDYIEDMEVRTSIAEVDGQVQIETSFRLQHDKSQALRATLLGADQEFGAWTIDRSARPQELVAGDKVAVQVGGFSGQLKPNNTGMPPNATVAGPPELIGKNAAGFDVYKVQVSLVDGTVGTLHLEDRGQPTINLMEWDQNKVVKKPIGSASLSSVAASAGWKKVASHTGTEAGKGTWSIDPKTGVAKLSGSSFVNMGHGEVYERVLEDGVVVRVSSSPETRNTFDGRVTIRVPEGHPNPELATARAMEVVGIPPEAQAPPTKEAVVKMALSKVNSQFAEFYDRNMVSTATLDNPQAALDVIDKAIGDTLGRPATLDDLSLRVMDDGGIQVLVSTEIAQAIAKKNGATYYQHSFDSGPDGDRFIINAMTGKTPGLLSGADRNKAGIFTTNINGSQTTDSNNGGANRVFFRARTQTVANSSSSIVMDVQQAHRQLDYYFQGGFDAWGLRKEGANWGFLYFTGDGKKGIGNTNTTNEILFKRGTEAQSWGRIIVTSERRTRLLKELSAQGVTHAPNGMPIEEFIVTEVKADQVSGTVPHYGDEIALGGIL